ncbi:MAG: anion permease, partial [Candidatus Sericytochromatia bacterium]
MHSQLILLILVVIVALIFDYINGFHDTANSIATVVSTRVLRPTQAVMLAAGFNLLGAFLGVEVAKTIGKGMVDAGAVTQLTVFAALLGAIIWNLITWYYGIPSSSSHALIGSLCGAATAYTGLGSLNTDGLLHKVFIPMVVSPVLGLVVGFIVMTSLYWILFKAKPGFVNRWFSKLQLVSAGFMALSHGSNDAQKTMGIITLALISYGITQGVAAPTEFHVPFWVVIACAMAMGAGTLAGGWR